jgi:hypothetical protein
MRETTERVPQVMQDTFNAVVKLMDEICNLYLNEEYAALARRIASVLSRKRPSPLLRGKIEAWACGILYALGYVNFLFDPSQKPHLTADQLCRICAVSQATGYNKSKTIRDLLQMIPFDPDWCLKSRLEDNPLVWMIEVNGIAVDVRMMPLELQQIAFERGLIPYIPSQKKQTGSIEIRHTDLATNQKVDESGKQQGKEEKPHDDPSQQALDF